eukprot:sb/3474425/
MGITEVSDMTRDRQHHIWAYHVTRSTILEIMVPVSKKGFIPGELVHTGEVMVHYGDSWFVNRTVKQGNYMVTIWGNGVKGPKGTEFFCIRFSRRIQRNQNYLSILSRRFADSENSVPHLDLIHRVTVYKVQMRHGVF